MFRSKTGEVTEVPVNGSIVISSATALREAMLAGLGAALLQLGWYAERLRQDERLTCFPSHVVTGASKESGGWLLYTSRKFIPAKVRSAIDFLKNMVGP